MHVMHATTKSDTPTPSPRCLTSKRLALVPVTRKFISPKKRLRTQDGVDKKLESLTRQLSDLQNRMNNDEAEKELQQLKGFLKVLQKENESLKVENKDLQEENTTLRAECQRLGGDEIVLTTPIKKLRRLATQTLKA